MPVNYLSFVASEHQEQVTLPRRHMRAVEGLMERIEGMSVEVENLLFLLLESPYAAQDSLDAADEYIHRERLDLVVVCAELKRPHLVFAVAACGYYQ